MQPRPSSLHIAKMMYSLRRGFLPSPSQISFFFRSNRRTISLLSWAAASSPLLLFLSQNTYQIMWISGRSMTPFLNTDFDRTTSRDAVLVKLWQPAVDLHRGDVVAFWTPHNPGRMAVKRVLALEGDEVRVRGGSAMAKVVAEIETGASQETGTGRATQGRDARIIGRDSAGKGRAEAAKPVAVVVPQGHIWVEGDNPEGRFSMDSNTFGPISKSLVSGRVVAGVWPKMAWVRWQDWTKNKRVRENVVVHGATVVRPGDVEGFK